MAWIKRNLYFLLGGVIALVLLGVASFYLYTQHGRSNELTNKLDATYGELSKLNSQKPHPGNGKIDNIKTAKEQHQQMHGFIRNARKFFEPIPPIPATPEGGGIKDETFAAQLRTTIEQLQRAAATASVTLPPRYDFSFSAIKAKISFASGSLHPLSAQLGEVKTLCDLLFTAKVNALDSIRRVKVSTDDKDVPDYTELPATTNEMAVLTPYELTFRCFSSELAQVFTGFTYSPHGFIVKNLTIEPANASATAPDPTLAGNPNFPTAPPVVTDPLMPPPAPRAGIAPGAGAAKGGLPTVLNERPLRVTMVVEVVKLKKTGN